MILLNKFITNYKSNNKLLPLKDHPAYLMDGYYMIGKKYNMLLDLGANDKDHVYSSRIKIIKKNNGREHGNQLNHIPKKGIEIWFDPYKSVFKRKYKAIMVDTSSYARAYIGMLYTGEFAIHTFDF